MTPTVNFAGIASGLDTNSLIQALIDQRRAQRITPLEDRNEQLQETNGAVASLKTKVTELQTLLRRMSSLNGGALSRLASSSNETYVTATAGNSASNGSYTLNVLALATNETDSFRSSAGTYTDSTDAIAS